MVVMLRLLLEVLMGKYSPIQFFPPSDFQSSFESRESREHTSNLAIKMCIYQYPSCVRELA